MIATKILIIDDEKEFTDMLQMQMRRRGNVQLRVTNDALEALAVAREFKPDVILLDIVMPGKDGGELLNEFERDPTLSGVPIIVISALASQAEADAGQSTNGHPLVSKPVKSDDLVARIEAEIGRPLR